MYKLNQKVVVALSAVILTASIFPMSAHAYTDREIHNFLGTPTMQDVLTNGAETDALNQIFNATITEVPGTDALSVDTGVHEPGSSVAGTNTIFDAVYYADKYPDLKAAYGYDSNLLYNHFSTVGIIEGRQASANFNVMVYKDNNPDLQNVFHDNWPEYYNHFVNGGYLENRISH